MNSKQPPSTRRHRRRSLRRLVKRGHATLVVLVFLTVGLALITVNQRQTASTLRVEGARVAQSDFEEGPLQLLADALLLLETGLPPANPYECGKTIPMPSGNEPYLIVYTSSAANQWSVQVAPTTDLIGVDPMPASFAN